MRKPLAKKEDFMNVSCIRIWVSIVYDFFSIFPNILVVIILFWDHWKNRMSFVFKFFFSLRGAASYLWYWIFWKVLDLSLVFFLNFITERPEIYKTEEETVRYLFQVKMLNTGSFETEEVCSLVKLFIWEIFGLNFQILSTLRLARNEKFNQILQVFHNFADQTQLWTKILTRKKLSWSHNN